MPAMTLDDVAPRLARARDAFVADHVAVALTAATAAAALRLKIADAESRVLRLEWLVAHRDLQLIRAGAVKASHRSRAKYVGHRHRKLLDAQAELAAARRRLAKLRGRLD